MFLLLDITVTCKHCIVKYIQIHCICHLKVYCDYTELLIIVVEQKLIINFCSTWARNKEFYDYQKLCVPVLNKIVNQVWLKYFKLE